MKKLSILALACVSALALSGCAMTVRSEPFPPPVVVDNGPFGDVVIVDYWFDGSVYYYYDADLGIYFYYDSFGYRTYCNRGWFPHNEWHRHDGGWNRDGGWHRGHEGGRFPGEGHRGNPFPGGDHHPGDGGHRPVPLPPGGPVHVPGGDHGGHFPGGDHGGRVPAPGGDHGGHFPGGDHGGRVPTPGGDHGGHFPGGGGHFPEGGHGPHR